MQVLGGMVDESIAVQEPPKRDEPSKTTPQRGAKFWFRSIIYENKWTPPPELIPNALRFTRTGRGLREPKANTQEPMHSSGMIVRTIPSSYSEQVLG
jgi:hypothetical protein